MAQKTRGAEEDPSEGPVSSDEIACGVIHASESRMADY